MQKVPCSSPGGTNFLSIFSSPGESYFKSLVPHKRTNPFVRRGYFLAQVRIASLRDIIVQRIYSGRVIIKRSILL